MKLHLALKIFFAGMACWGLSYFCKVQTGGFREYAILSNLENDPRWELPPLAAEEKHQIDALLDQPFTFLGSGGWCYAFLGKDQKTVLKFYKHSHLLLSSIFKDFAFEKLVSRSAPWPKGLRYPQELNFKSCTLVYKLAKERSGLLYIHINKTEGMHKPVTLYDKIGVKHVIDLDKTEFVVQRRADLLIPHIEELVKQKKIDEAKECLDDFIACLLQFAHNGIKDLDTSLRKNYGFIEGKAVSFDLSSFVSDESLKHPGSYRKEVVLKSQRLSRHLRKNHPELFTYYESRIHEVCSSK